MCGSGTVCQLSNVLNASTVNEFKSKLDAHWSKQEKMYNHRAEMTGTGSRSFAQWVFLLQKLQSYEI